MKKFMAMLLALVMALSLVACGQKADDTAKDDANTDNTDDSLVVLENVVDWGETEPYRVLVQKGDPKGLLPGINKAIAELTANDGALIKEIEDKLESLEKEFPGCGSTPSAGESVDASTAGMTAGANASSEATKFPSFTGKDLDGNDVNSDELFSKNKVTVMNFWFTTCKPCVGELGDLEKLNQELAKKGGQVVGVNSFTLDGNKGEIADAKDVLSKKGVTYKNIWFKSDSEAGKFTSNLFSFPTTYVIDQNGNIVGDPIVGAISSAEQRAALDKLIDQAIANSEQ